MNTHEAQTPHLRSDTELSERMSKKSITQYLLWTIFVCAGHKMATNQRKGNGISDEKQGKQTENNINY